MLVHYIVLNKYRHTLRDRGVLSKIKIGSSCFGYSSPMIQTVIVVGSRKKNNVTMPEIMSQTMYWKGVCPLEVPPNSLKKSKGLGHENRLLSNFIASIKRSNANYIAFSRKFIIFSRAGKFFKCTLL